MLTRALSGIQWRVLAVALVGFGAGSCRSYVSVDQVLSKKFGSCTADSVGGMPRNLAQKFCSAAASLGWRETSPLTSGTTVTAVWTKSQSALLANQGIQFFRGNSCGDPLDAAIDLGSATVESHTFTGVFGETYTFKVTSFDAKNNSLESDCSAAMQLGASAASVPVVTGVTSPQANNLYSASQSLSIQVIFSEAVVVVGAPQLELETGVNDGLAYFTSGSGSNTLVFTYTVSPDHTSLDLDYKGIGSLSLNGGSIKSLAGIAASVVLAPPGSPSSLGANKNLVIDTIPSVQITSNRDPGPTSNASIVLTFSFSEAVTGFDTGDVTVTNATKGLFSVVSANLYTLELTATGSSVSASLPANAVLDVSGNQNAPSATWSIIYDNLAPTVTISSNRDPGPTNQSEMTLTITFSEPVTGFSIDDVIVNNAQKGTFTATSASVYSLNVSATGASVSASVPSMAASDAAGNGNIAAMPWSIAFDNVAPTVAITSNRDPGPTNNASILLTFTFSEAVTGFDVSDVSVTNATKGAFNTVSSSVYTLAITATGAIITANVAGSVAIDTAMNANTAANTFNLTYDTTGPVIQSLSINNNDPTTTSRYLNVAMTVTDALGSNVTHVCMKYVNATPPNVSSDCWLPVSTHPMNLTPQPTLTITNYRISIGMVAGTYTVYGFAKDQLGNISSLSSAGSGTLGVDSDNILYSPGIPAKVQSLIVANTESPSALTPPKNETLFTSGQTVYIKWQITDNGAIPAGSISLYYTTDDNNYQLITSSLNDGSNGGCQMNHPGTSVDDATTGCYTWTAPTNQYFAVQLRVTDAEGIQSLFRSGLMNGLGLRVIAGSMDPGIEGSGLAAVFTHQYIHGVWPDGNNLLVGSDGRIYFMDAAKGILYVNPVDGALRVLLAKAATITGDGGPVSAATMRATIGIAFDHQERVLVYDYDRIRRIDTTANPMTIQTIIGGGTDQSETTTASALRIPDFSGTVDRAAFPFFATPDGKIYFTTTSIYGQLLKNTRLRVFNPANGVVSTIRLTGQGTSYDSQSDVSECWASAVGYTYDLGSSLITKIVSHVYHYSTIPLCTSVIPTADGRISFSGEGVSTAPHPPAAPFSTWYLRTGMNGALYTGGAAGLARYNHSTNNWTNQIGTGTRGACDDGTLATACNVNMGGFFIDRQGRIYFVETGRIRMVNDEGRVVTLVGQGFSSGDGGIPTAGRFSYVRNLAYTDSGKIVALDANAGRIRQVTPGTLLETLAGNGNSGAPNFTDLANIQPIVTGNFGDDIGFGIDRSTGTIYFGSDRRLARLNRTTGKWEQLAGGGATGYASADGLVGTAINLGFYNTHVVGFGNGKAIIHTGSYSGATNTHFDQMLKLYDITDQGRQSHLLGKTAPLGSDACADGTSTNQCGVPISVYPQYMPAIYDTFSSRWLLMKINANALRTLEEGPTAVIGTFATLPRNARSFTYYRNAVGSVRKIFYCGHSDGLLYQYDLNTATDAAIPWPATSVRCNGYSIEYDALNNRLFFPVTQDKLSAIAEFSL